MATANDSLLTQSARLGIILSGRFLYCYRLERYAFIELIRFGGDLLSHVLRRSTIGAVALNCRVRDGIGCFAYAMTTKPNKFNKCPSQYSYVCVYAFE